jgi:hypothetical protein
VAYMYSLPELKVACLKWLTVHYQQMWRSRSIAALPPDILDDILTGAENSIVCTLQDVEVEIDFAYISYGSVVQLVLACYLVGCRIRAV